MKSGQRYCALQLHKNYTKTFIISSYQNKFFREIFLNSAPINEKETALNTNSAVAQPFFENPSNCQHFHLILQKTSFIYNQRS